MRQQHKVPPINNPVNGQGIYNCSPHFTQQSPQQQLQQSQSTAGSSMPMLMVNNPQYRQNFQGQHQRQPTPPVPHVHQQVRPSTPPTFNQQYNQYQVPQASLLLAQPQYNPHIPPPYLGQWQKQAPSVQSNHSDNNSNVSQIYYRNNFKFMREKEEAHEQCKLWKEEQEKRWKGDNNTKIHTNKAFKKIERFDRSHRERCMPWLEEMFAMIDNHGRNHREELLFNSGGSVQKTLYSISPEATPEKIKDILFRNHSNLKMPSQCTSAFQSIQQKPDEALCTTLDMSHITSWLTQASTLTMTLQELVVSSTLTW